jgi:transposase InsO family protein
MVCSRLRSSGEEDLGVHWKLELATLEWVDWFNNRRLLEPIGNMPPAEAEERYYAQLQEMALAA